MNIIRDFDGVITQSFTISTDLLASGITCPLSCSAASWPAYAQLNSFVVSADTALTTAADVGPHVLSVTCGSIAYPATVASKSYSFTVTVQHCVVNTFSIAAISNVSYVLYSGPLSVPYTNAVWSNQACYYTATYSASFALGGVTIAPPAFVVLDPASSSFMIDSYSPTDKGTYTVTLTAQIPQPSDPSGVKTVSTSFVLDAIDPPCGTSSLVNLILPDITILVGETFTESLFFENSSEILTGQPKTCGPRTITFFSSVSPLSKAVIFDSVLYTFTVTTVDPADIGSFTLSYSVQLQGFPLVPSISGSFQVTILDNICDVTSITAVKPPASMVYTINVDNFKEVSFDFVEKPVCGLIYSLSASHSFITLDPLLKLIRVQTTDLTTTGTYNLVLNVVPAKTGVQLAVPFTVKIQSSCANTQLFPDTRLTGFEMFIQEPSSLLVSQTLQITYDAMSTGTDCGAITFRVFDPKTGDSPDWASIN